MARRRDAWNANVDVNDENAYDNNPAMRIQRVAGSTTVDLRLAYQFDGGCPTLTNPAGRLVSLSLGKHF